MTGEWFNRDSIAASEWVANLPPSANRDSAASRLVGHLISADSPDIDSAMHWAESIGDQHQRDLLLSNVFVQLLKDNPEAGREAVEASALPKEAKQRLLER